MTATTITLPAPTLGPLALRRITLRPGLIDAHASEMFRFGYCHLLSCALHEITGLPIVGLDCPDHGQYLHSGVVTSDNTFWDIHGPRPVEQVRTSYTDPCVPHHVIRSVNGPAAMACLFIEYTDRPLPTSIPERDWWQHVLPPEGTRAVIALAAALHTGTVTRRCA